MATALDMIDNLSKFNVKAQTTKIFNNNAVHVTTLNQAQMLKSKKRTGEGIGKYKSPEYAAIKAKQNPEAGAGNVDLKLKEGFYRGMIMKIVGNIIDIKSTDAKSPALQRKYGDDIFGLTPENWQIWLDEIFMPDYMIEFTKATGLKI